MPRKRRSGTQSAEPVRTASWLESQFPELKQLDATQRELWGRLVAGARETLPSSVDAHQTIHYMVSSLRKRLLEALLEDDGRELTPEVVEALLRLPLVGGVSHESALCYERIPEYPQGEDLSRLRKAQISPLLGLFPTRDQLRALLSLSTEELNAFVDHACEHGRVSFYSLDSIIVELADVSD